MNADNLTNALHQFTGTEHLYRYMFGLNLTDGAKFLAEKASCYWLFDIIASYQMKTRRDPMLREMQFWTLKVKDGKGVVTCERDAGDVAIKQKIDFTDFPLSEIKIYVANNVVMLPSEY